MYLGAVMVPHPPVAVKEIGRGEEKKIQPTLDGFRKAAEFIAQKKPELIILTSPHAVMYRDYFNVSAGRSAYGDFSRYRASSVRMEVCYDEEFTRELTSFCSDHHFPCGTQYDRDTFLDQGTMVPLYFLNQVYRDFKLVRIGLSGFPLTMHYQLGEYIRTVAESLGRRWMFVASGDLSHCQKTDGPYGFHPEGPEYDSRIMHTMGTGSFGELLNYDEAFLNKAEECGHRSFTILAGSLDCLSVMPQVISHEATLGVGYGVVLYEIGKEDPSRSFLAQYLDAEEKEIADKKSDAYVQLARSSVTSWVKHYRVLEVPSELPAGMKKEKAGVFVSIHENGELRGCIGTTEPTRKNIAAEIIHNAISACSRDPRFDPITEAELPYLDISVDVLKEPEPIASKADLDVKKYGVICSSEGRRGLLLPDLEGVDTPDQQIAIACRKAGIDPEHDSVALERFEVVRHV